ncbi:hypothetical protein [Massilia sp. TS11]|uniref:hypothetical protein n=1 Tax=Massilia sp. TS11 TaxID=2908003 RepID=UPI001ED9C6F0|nr:hypothetical protein [Massilia sp. TS11]MCG2583875.1 hypothetical protein [Massilia sp. TS11]
MNLKHAIACFSLVQIQMAAGATALRNDRPTDDSVCDFGHNTSAALGIIGFVPWDTKDLHEVYARMIVSWTASHCRDGQLLIIDATYGKQTEDRYAGLASRRLCKVADIKQTPKGTTDHPQAFELRCTISKLAEAKSWAAAEDARQSLDAMILERSEILKRGGGPPEKSKDSPVDKSFDKTMNKCASKPSISTILFGGGDCPKQ